ncbi:MAG: insulinase family protein [Chitinispirillales bacterium]|nr:insulinase family protein [Chitinispirillales bacterium]
MTEGNVPEQKIKNGEIVSGFELQDTRKIPELRSTAYQFSHKKTGARLIHLFNDDPNNLFSVAFRTPVSDSTGVPHILEHSVLCGSKKFPLKDPFQELLKGSLQTFLNALTYPDKTVYPVSSQVEKDYYNLVDVYCDAVFNPLLTENTFYQEGWHYDLEKMDDPVGIKGIVYNEMKGVFSDFSNHVGRHTVSALFPDTTYFYESGGNPENIPDLTYEQFREFHKKYYHPSNSYIFLYGNLPSEKTLGFLDEKYLSVFEGAVSVDSSIALQSVWDKPRTLSLEAPASEEEDGNASVILAWVFGRSTDPVSAFSGSILSHYLLGTESSPLKRALIDSGLGEDLDDMSGFDSELSQCVFAAGLRKCKPEKAQAVNDLIIATLRKQEENGLDKELLEGSLRQVEFRFREITGGSFPYNLRLADRCYRSWIHDGDPFSLLMFEKPLSFIKEEMAKGGFFENFIRKNLVDNNHRLLLVVTASFSMGKKLEEQSAEQAKRLTSHFSESDKQRCLELTKVLRTQQATPSSSEAAASLPKLTKSDLPKKGKKIPFERGKLGDVELFMHPIFTSGIAYVDIGFDMRGIPSDLITFIPLYLDFFTRCGTHKYSYEQMARRISLSTGGIDASVSCKTKIGTSDELFFMAFVHGKALEPRFGELLDIFSDLLLTPDFSNRKQVKDLLLEQRNSLNSCVVSSGHSFAISEASSRLSKTRFVDEQLTGVAQLRFLDTMVKKEDYDLAIDSCKRLHEFLINRSACVISVTSADPSKLREPLESFTAKLPVKIRTEQKPLPFTLSSDVNKGIEISSAVNFVAKVWKMNGLDAAEYSRLFLLSRNLSTSYLWDKIRVEGGAYGGMAGMSISHPLFSCASYRDPNLEQTLSHFEKGLAEAASGIPAEKVDQSVVGAVGRIDAPKSPHGEGLGETMDILAGYTDEYRQEFRNALLGATSQDLKHAAGKVLGSKEWAVTALGSGAAFEKSAGNGVSFEREKLFS